MLEMEVVYGAMKPVSVIIAVHYGGRKAQRDSQEDSRSERQTSGFLIEELPVLQALNILKGSFLGTTTKKDNFAQFNHNSV